ncbi:hypothetical protein AVEN_227198-1, partial [Araneus ventricosus]
RNFEIPSLQKYFLGTPRRVGSGTEKVVAFTGDGVMSVSKTMTSIKDPSSSVHSGL